METAISVPDELFERAEAIAKTLHVSRSELYARALSNYLEKEDDVLITARLNEFFDANPPEPLDPGFKRAAAKVLRNSEW
jgi:hypothetical protein